MDVALAAATKDSDLLLDPRTLGGDPLLEQAMRSAGFSANLDTSQPGSWLSPGGVPVDLMVPEALAGAGSPSARAARIPPHGRKTTRRVLGLEAAIVDHAAMEVASLVDADPRRYTANVAGPAGLLVAKLHKLGEHRDRDPRRLKDKDAHDVYRLLVAVPTATFAEMLTRLVRDPFAGRVSEEALGYLRAMFAAGPDATGSVMAGRAEDGVGEPAVVAASVSVLARELVAALPVSIAAGRS